MNWVPYWEWLGWETEEEWGEGESRGCAESQTGEGEKEGGVRKGVNTLARGLHLFSSLSSLLSTLQTQALLYPFLSSLFPPPPQPLRPLPILSSLSMFLFHLLPSLTLVFFHIMPLGVSSSSVLLSLTLPRHLVSLLVLLYPFPYVCHIPSHACSPSTYYSDHFPSSVPCIFCTFFFPLLYSANFHSTKPLSNFHSPSSFFFFSSPVITPLPSISSPRPPRFLLASHQPGVVHTPAARGGTGCFSQSVPAGLSPRSLLRSSPPGSPIWNLPSASEWIIHLLPQAY